MKRKIVPLAAAAIMLGFSANADPFIDAVVKNFRDLGYEFVEIERGPTQLRAEGVRGSEELTVIYDLATGRIIRQESGRADVVRSGRSGVEIANRDRDFTGRGGRARDDIDDDDDDDDDDGDRRGSRGGFDSDDDDDDRSSSGSGGRDNDDDDDDNDNDDDDDDDDDD